MKEPTIATPVATPSEILSSLLEANDNELILGLALRALELEAEKLNIAQVQVGHLLDRVHNLLKKGV